MSMAIGPSGKPLTNLQISGRYQTSRMIHSTDLMESHFLATKAV